MALAAPLLLRLPFPLPLTFGFSSLPPGPGAVAGSLASPSSSSPCAAFMETRRAAAGGVYSPPCWRAA